MMMACSVILVPASLGIAGNTLPAAFGQFTFEPDGSPDDGNVDNGTDTVTTPPTGNANAGSVLSSPTFLLRGLAGGVMQENRNQTIEGQAGQGYVVAGRWRMFVNENEVQRFVANISMARIDGTDSHNVYIENTPSRFELSRNGDAFTSEISVYVLSDGSDVNPSNRVTPATVQVAGDVLQVQIDINEEGSTGAHILALDTNPVYGIVEFEQAGPS